MSFLDDLAGKPVRLVAGVMSGTSMDSIDVAICSITGAGQGAQIELQRFESFSYSKALKERLHQSASGLKVKDIAELHVEIGEAFASAVLAASSGLQLDLIGSHGQTIFHHSRQADLRKATLQVGDGDVISTRTGVPVISDFRSKDIALGGEGAPLTPYADFILFGGAGGRVVLNLGGIANLTVLSDKLDDVRGYDTGPANAPLDWVAKADLSCDFDDLGATARSGRFDRVLLDKLLYEDTFIQALPPKSTGTERYGKAFAEHVRHQSGSSGSDLLRLLTEFVAGSIAIQVPTGTVDVVAAGGGTKNDFLMERLAAHLPIIGVLKSDDLGVPSQAREAMAFAILANDAVCGIPTSLPRVTGASARRSLGKISFP
jgi:anhydro-N-acetylmuramic acid kinase